MERFKFYMFFVWIAAMMLSCWAWEVARMFARRMQKEAQRRAARAAGTFVEPDVAWPAVAVILPIKGVDDDTEENLRALFVQRYPRHRLLFAVESAADPVIPLLERLKAELAAAAPITAVSIDTIIAGIATTRGQKIHNQLAAVAQTTERDEVLVFMDADARPSSGWLRDLVQPLVEHGGEKGQVGASTGFRFYIPQPAADTGNPALPSIMASVINAAVAALLGPGWRNIAWGGSMALFRRDFFAYGVSDAWQTAISDDYVLSWCVKNQSKRKIQFVQGCLVASSAEFRWPAFWEFAARQYCITKICAPGVWLTAIGAALLYLTGMAYTLAFFLLSAAGMVPAHSLTGSVDYLLGVMFLALYIANWMRGRFLLQGGLVGLPEHAAQLRRAGFWYTWAYPATLAVNLLALLKSAAGSTIEWRGVRYRMKNRLQTTVERHHQNS